MANRFEDVKTVQELIYQAVGAGSICWDNPGGAGVFDDEQANAVASEALKRLGELLNIPPKLNDVEVNLSMEFQQFIRKPFVVEALEITRENIHELSDMIGTFGEDETGPFIQADPDKVPTVTRVTPGYWVTKMGRNIRCYSPKVFDEQFIQNTPELQAVLGDIEDGKVKASRG